MAEPTVSIIVESFILKNRSGHRGDVHMRPAANQVFPQSMMVQCNKEMLDTNLYPVGTRFRYNVRLVTKASGNKFLGSHHSWPFDVIEDAEFLKLYPVKPDGTVRIGGQGHSRPDRLPEPKGNSSPSMKSVLANQFGRDDSVKAWVLRQANGNCEGCKQGAPFNSVDGLPYLEVHHVCHLSNGGSDTIRNTVALCPNCHKEIHYGASSEKLITRLYETVTRLVRG